MSVSLPVIEARPAVWADVPEKTDGYHEYAWSGPVDEVAAFVRGLPEGSAVARLWRGVLIEGQPEVTIVRFRSPVEVRQPVWAARVSTELANATAGVFAGR
jgi:hypothetical protein